MSKFSVGDRVAIYSHMFPRRVGTIRIIAEDGGIVLDESMAKYHPKQCRLLKKRQRRRIFIQKDDFDGFMHGGLLRVWGNNRGSGQYYEFVEVRRK